tara:strand:- start:141 stop:425 length:285 start_codon:yes stop_codon:yes gene_type:complete
VFTVEKPCKSCKSYVLVPKNKLKLNLNGLRLSFEELGFKIVAYTGTLLSVRKNCKVNIYVSGKIVIITKDKKEAMEIKDELSNILYVHTRYDSK